MSWLSGAWPWLIAMLVLILLSAFFSGSEAALFSLNHRGRRSLARSGMAGAVAARLLERPERLLSAILFWNLLINMTYFAIAAIVGGRLESDPIGGRPAAVAFTIVSLLGIIFFSEMLPKSVAVLAPVRFSMLVGAPLSVSVRLVRPILPLVAVSNRAVRRLIWPTFEPEPEIDLADIERAIELGTDDAALLRREQMALRGLVQMAELRVSDIMRPRSKLWICRDPSDPNILAQPLPARSYLMVTDVTGDMITGAIGLRTLRPSQMDDLQTACEPVIYVPWSALVSQVLDQLNEESRSVAVVVNEFGELMGAVSIDQILRVVLARRDEESFFGDPSIQEVGSGKLRVQGTVAVRSLARRLGITVSEEGITTVAGYIQRFNERVPRVGDSAPMENFTLTVQSREAETTWILVSPNESSEEDAS